MSNTEWPDSFDLDTPADVTQRIKAFIQDELAKLKAFDGKRAEWEAIALLPFIDEKLLLSAVAVADTKLNEKEKARNILSEDTYYRP